MTAMSNDKITIEGDVPSKKNSRQCFVRNGHMMNIPSKRYSEWHSGALAQLRGVKQLNPPYRIYMKFWMKTNRRADLDNKMASILDALQDAMIIQDDCWQKLELVQATAGGIDKERPRVEIEIHSAIDK